MNKQQDAFKELYWGDLLDQCEAVPVKNERQYERALQRIYVLMDKKLRAGSKDAIELEVLSILVKQYENEHYPVPKPHPVEAIKFRLEQMGLTEKELSKILGYRSRKSDLLSGRRKLSLTMIRKLNTRLHIPASVLIQSY